MSTALPSIASSLPGTEDSVTFRTNESMVPSSSSSSSSSSSPVRSPSVPSSSSSSSSFSVPNPVPSLPSKQPPIDNSVSVPSSHSVIDTTILSSSSPIDSTQSSLITTVSSSSYPPFATTATDTRSHAFSSSTVGTEITISSASSPAPPSSSTTSSTSSSNMSTGNSPSPSSSSIASFTAASLPSSPQSILFSAIELGDINLVHHLLEYEHVNPNAVDHQQNTPLKLSCILAQPDIARLLLQYNAKLDEEDQEGQTPLHAAARTDAGWVACLIVAGADVNATDKLGLTPLHDSACEGKSHAVRFLLAAGADPSAVDRHGKTALHYAAESGYTDVIDALLGKPLEGYDEEGILEDDDDEEEENDIDDDDDDDEEWEEDEEDEDDDDDDAEDDEDEMYEVTYHDDHLHGDQDQDSIPEDLVLAHGDNHAHHSTVHPSSSLSMDNTVVDDDDTIKRRRLFPRNDDQTSNDGSSLPSTDNQGSAKMCDRTENTPTVTETNTASLPPVPKTKISIPPHHHHPSRRHPSHHHHDHSNNPVVDDIGLALAAWSEELADFSELLQVPNDEVSGIPSMENVYQQLQRLRELKLSSNGTTKGPVENLTDNGTKDQVVAVEPVDGPDTGTINTANLSSSSSSSLILSENERRKLFKEHLLQAWSNKLSEKLLYEKFVNQGTRSRNSTTTTVPRTDGNAPTPLPTETNATEVSSSAADILPIVPLHDPSSSSSSSSVAPSLPLSHDPRIPLAHNNAHERLLERKLVLSERFAKTLSQRKLNLRNYDSPNATVPVPPPSEVSAKETTPSDTGTAPLSFPTDNTSSSSTVSSSVMESSIPTDSSLPPTDTPVVPSLSVSDPGLASFISHSVQAKDSTGRSPIFYATMKGRIAAVRSLIAAGADVQSRDDDGKSLLHYAALGGYASMVAFLISVCHLDPNVRDKTGQTPLYCAAEKGHINAARNLIIAKADVNAHDDGDNGVTPLRRAAACGHVAMIHLLVSAGALLDWASHTGNNALHDAAWNGRSEAVFALVKSGCNIGARDNHNWTALHYAADHGRTEAIQTLVSLGADVSAKTRDRWTPLRLAAKGGHVETVKALLNARAKFLVDDEEENFKQSPLHAAARLRDSNERRSTVETLILAGADLSARDKEGWTPVHCAAANGHADTLRTLINAGACVDGVDNHGLTPLREAAAAGHTAAVEALLQAGADANAKCRQGYTPLHDASWQGRTDAFRVLLTSGADPRIKAVDGRTPLHCAAQRGHTAIVELLLPYCTSSTDLSPHDKEGWTPLHKAAQEGHAEIIRTMVNAGADINAVHIYSSTPLHEAAANGDAKTVHTLLQLGADIHLIDAQGYTPLHSACKSTKKSLGVVILLLAAGANPYTKTTDLQTPLHLSARVGNYDVTELLLRWGCDVGARDNERHTAMDISTGAQVKKLLRLWKTGSSTTMNPTNGGNGSIHHNGNTALKIKTLDQFMLTTVPASDARSIIQYQYELIEMLHTLGNINSSSNGDHPSGRNDSSSATTVNNNNNGGKKKNDTGKTKTKKDTVSTDSLLPAPSPTAVSSPSTANVYAPIIYSYNEILEATDYFALKTEYRGIYGNLYETQLRNKRVIVKHVQLDPDIMTNTGLASATNTNVKDTTNVSPSVPNTNTNTPTVSLYAHLRAEINTANAVRSAMASEGIVELSHHYTVPVVTNTANDTQASGESNTNNASSPVPTVTKGKNNKRKHDTTSTTDTTKATANDGSTIATKKEHNVPVPTVPSVAPNLDSIPEFLRNVRHLLGYALLPHTPTGTTNNSNSSNDAHPLLFALVYTAPLDVSLPNWSSIDRHAVEMERATAIAAAELAAAEAEAALLALSLDDDEDTPSSKKSNKKNKNKEKEKSKTVTATATASTATVPLPVSTTTAALPAKDLVNKLSKYMDDVKRQPVIAESKIETNGTVKVSPKKNENGSSLSNKSSTRSNGTKNEDTKVLSLSPSAPSRKESNDDLPPDVLEALRVAEEAERREKEANDLAIAIASIERTVTSKSAGSDTWTSVNPRKQRTKGNTVGNESSNNSSSGTVSAKVTATTTGTVSSTTKANATTARVTHTLTLSAATTVKPNTVPVNPPKTTTATTTMTNRTTPIVATIESLVTKTMDTVTSSAPSRSFGDTSVPPTVKPATLSVKSATSPWKTVPKSTSHISMDETVPISLHGSTTVPSSLLSKPTPPSNVSPVTSISPVNSIPYRRSSNGSNTTGSSPEITRPSSTELTVPPTNHHDTSTTATLAPLFSTGRDTASNSSTTNESSFTMGSASLLSATSAVWTPTKSSTGSTNPNISSSVVNNAAIGIPSPYKVPTAEASLLPSSFLPSSSASSNTLNANVMHNAHRNGALPTMQNSFLGTGPTSMNAFYPSVTSSSSLASFMSSLPGTNGPTNSLLPNVTLPSMSDYLLPSSNAPTMNGSTGSTNNHTINRSLIYPSPPPLPSSSSSVGIGGGIPSTVMYPSTFASVNGSTNNYFSSTVGTNLPNHGIGGNAFIPSLAHPSLAMNPTNPSNNYFSSTGQGNTSNGGTSTLGYPLHLANSTTNYVSNPNPSLGHHLSSHSRSTHHPTSINPRANPVSSLTGNSNHGNNNNLLPNNTLIGGNRNSIGHSLSSSSSASSSSSSSSSATSSASTTANMVRTMTGQSTSSSGYGFEGDVELNELVAGIIED